MEDHISKRQYSTEVQKYSNTSEAKENLVHTHTNTNGVITKLSFEDSREGNNDSIMPNVNSDRNVTESAEEPILSNKTPSTQNSEGKEIGKIEI